MFAKIKKMLFVIPCMILGLFLFTEVSISAADAVLLESKKVVVGEENRENTYYFTSDSTWEFQAKFNAVKDYDTFLKYRVVRPDGSATAWSGKEYYVNNGGKFNISDFKSLSYTETVDVSTRVSIAPASTYYVDVKYYGEYLYLIEWDQKKDETLKIVVSGTDDNLNIPAVDVKYNSTEKTYTVISSVLKDGVGYSAITDIEYYFATEGKDNSTVYAFYKNKNESSVNGALTFVPASEVSASFEAPEDNSANKYVYVMVTTGNGYSKIVEFSIESGNVSNEDTLEKESNTNTGTGLFDYDFGELILLVLVVVLIVSCALIITQKIVDYKKRLY